jgi:hypothetical protein
MRDPCEAMMECLEHALYAGLTIIEDADKHLVIDSLSLLRPVRYYGYKDLSLLGDKPDIKRPCMIVAMTSVPDGSTPKIAGSDYPYIARCGVVVYFEAPIVFESGGKEYGGRDDLLIPMTEAFADWVKATPALLVPDAVRYLNGDPDDAVVFNHHTIDLRRDNPFRNLGRRGEYERFTYYLIMETIEVT